MRFIKEPYNFTLCINVVVLISCRYLPRQKIWQNHHATFNAHPIFFLHMLLPLSTVLCGGPFENITVHLKRVKQSTPRSLRRTKNDIIGPHKNNITTSFDWINYQQLFWYFRYYVLHDMIYILSLGVLA